MVGEKRVGREIGKGRRGGWGYTYEQGEEGSLTNQSKKKSVLSYNVEIQDSMWNILVYLLHCTY